MTALFLEDYQEYPDLIIDTETKNRSFVRYVGLLKEMGIKNAYFPLQLHNPELKKIDPFDPHLSFEEMAMVAMECKNNFFYYIREIARVPGGTFDDPILFRANRGNVSLFWLFFNHITVILVQIRQTGKSLSVDELMIYLMDIACTNAQINLLTKDDTLRTANLTRLKNIELELPFYLRMRTKADVGNTEELTVKALGNRYRGHLPNRSPKLALNVGRGLTSQVMQVDEASFFFNIAISLPAAFAATTAARENAERKGEPYGNILTTTAGKKDDRDGKFTFNLLMNSMIFTEKLFDCKDHEELEEVIKRNSPEGDLRVNCTFNHRQLGYTDEWLYRTIREVGATGEDADRDYFNRWTSGGQTNPIPVDIAKRIRDSEVSDYYSEIGKKYPYITRWYIPEQQIQSRLRNDFFIMGMDTSEAVGQDEIALDFQSIKTGEVIAAGSYNETNLIVFCQWLCDWFVAIPNFVLIIERRSTGAMIIDYLLVMLPPLGIDPFTRIYNKVVQEKDEYPERFKEIEKPMNFRDREIYTKFKKYFGFATSGTGLTSRSELYSTTLIQAVKTLCDVIKDKKIIDQILSLVTRNGRIDHDEGGHDDSVIAWLLSNWLMTKGKYLQFYGINSKDILCENRMHQEANDPQKLYQIQKTNYLKDKIDALVVQIKKESNEYVSRRLEMDLRRILNEIPESQRQILSVDELMKSIQEEKRLKQRIRSF